MTESEAKKKLREHPEISGGRIGLADICYACDKPIETRLTPKGIHDSLGNPAHVGKYTLRRSYYDEKWNMLTEDVYFHEECWFHGFAMAVKHGYLTWQQKEAYKYMQSYRSDHGVDHS